MAYNVNPSNKSWAATMADLRAMFTRWGVAEHWDWTCAAAETPAARKGNDWARRRSTPEMDAVTVTFTHPKMGARSVRVSKFATPADNLRAIWLGLDAIRLNENRGLSEIMAAVYTQIPERAGGGFTLGEPSPYAIIGVSPGATPAEINAAYRRRAAEAAGDEEALRRVNVARDAILPK